MSENMDTKIVRNRPKVALWGTSERALVIADIVRAQGEFEFVGFLDATRAADRGREFGGSRLLGGTDRLGHLQDMGLVHILPAVPEPGNRLALAAWLQEQGFELPVVIHPRAVLADDVVVGAGSVIAAGAVIGAGTRICDSVFVGYGAVIDSGCYVGEAVDIGAGARLAAQVHVNREARIGVGAIISQDSRIGIGLVAEDGALVYGGTDSYQVATGAKATYRHLALKERQCLKSDARLFMRQVLRAS